MKTKRIMLYVTGDEYDKLKRLADKEKRSLSNMALICIQKYLDKAAK